MSEKVCEKGSNHDADYKWRGEHAVRPLNAIRGLISGSMMLYRDEPGTGADGAQ